MSSTLEQHRTLTAAMHHVEAQLCAAMRDADDLRTHLCAAQDRCECLTEEHKDALAAATAAHEAALVAVAADRDEAVAKAAQVCLARTQTLLNKCPVRATCNSVVTTSVTQSYSQCHLQQCCRHLCDPIIPG